MQALIAILIFLLGVFVVVSTVLIVMAISLSRSIAHAKRNIRSISSNVDEAMTLAGAASSVYGLFLKLKPKKKLAQSAKRTRLSE